jgi:hypothetical protein
VSLAIPTSLVFDGFEYAGDNSAVDTREVGIAKDTYDALTRLNNSKCYAKCYW